MTRVIVHSSNSTVYADDYVCSVNNGVDQMDRIFSAVDTENRAICVTGYRINQAVLRPCGRYDAGFGSNLKGPVLPKIPL